MLRIRLRRLFSLAVGAATFVSLAVATTPGAAAADPGPTPYPVNPLPVHMDVSPPLASMQPASYNFESVLGNDRGAKPVPKRPAAAPTTGAPASPAAPSVSAPTPGLNFDGLGVGFNPSYLPCCAPPDTNASVGPNHIIETVNLDFVIFNKSGVAVYGPVPTNTLWSGFTGGCEVNNDGDPTVLYDSIADRWLISQFSVTGIPYLNCVAVSTTPDPLGSYYRYAFSYGNTDFIDYPKFGIWPDAYYVTFNVFANGVRWAGAKVCAYDRDKILTGATATQQCFQLGTAWGGLLPSTVNGVTPPPAGAPNFILGLDAPATSTLLQYWKFHVDWTTPTSTTFTGPTAITVASYTNSCWTLARGDCIPQGGGGTNLESLADRLMYRLNYRNLGDHAALVVNHTIEVGSGSTLHSGVRWYEIRPNAAHTSLALFQQGTYAPDANWRWMGSVNMDKSGNIGMGYSVSSSSISPQIHFTGRLAGDALGTMTQGENVIINGGGSQTGGLARWGDYSSTAMDPVDDCTFWHANEYLKASGAFNWSTRIAAFKLPNCGSPDYSLRATPSSVTVTAGSPANYTVTVTPSGGFTGTVALSASGTPAGASASFNPTSVAGGSGTSAMMVTTSASTPAGSYTLTITGTSGALSHTTSVTLVVNAPPTPDYTLTASPASQTVSPGASTTYTVTVTPTNGFTGTVTLSLGGLPTGASGSFYPTSLSSGSSILTVNSGTAAAGTYTLTITGSATGLQNHTTTVGFSIADYNLSISPSSSTVSAGAATSYAVTVNRPGGFSGSVAFSVSGLPAGAAGSFNPASTTGNSSTLSVTTSATSPTGSYVFTVTGTSGTTNRTTTATLVVSPAPTGDFQLSASPSSVSAPRGGTGTTTINITRTGGFAGSISLSTNTPPNGITPSFSPNPATGASSALTFTVGSTAATGIYSFTITGTSGGLTRTTTVTLTVTMGCVGGDGEC